MRDRRYTRKGIRELCENAGFSVIWVRRVKTGHWEHDDEAGKEILVLCQARQAPQGLLLLSGLELKIADSTPAVDVGAIDEHTHLTSEYSRPIQS